MANSVLRQEILNELFQPEFLQKLAMLVQPETPVTPKTISFEVPKEQTSSTNDVAQVLSGGVSVPEPLSTSWAESVEDEEDSSRSLTSKTESVVDGIPKYSDVLRNTIKFGGFDPTDDKEKEKQEKNAKADVRGVMATHVKTANALSLRKLLKSVGAQLPARSAYHIALVTHTAATMPSFFVGGKNALKNFAVLGDAALVACAAAASIKNGTCIESFQKIRTTTLTDASLCEKFAESPFKDFVSVAAGIDFKRSKTGATALEAIVGVVSYYAGAEQVSAVVKAFGIEF